MRLLRAHTEIYSPLASGRPLISNPAGGCCGISNHYTNNKVDQIDNCTKDTTTHLNRLHSIDVSSANFPEGLLILHRSCIFSVDRSAKSLSICPWHRDFFGIYWRVNSKDIQLAARQKLNYTNPVQGILAFDKTTYSSRIR